MIKNYCPKHWGARDPQDGEPEVELMAPAPCGMCGEPAARAAGAFEAPVPRGHLEDALRGEAAGLGVTGDAALGAADLVAENVRQSKRQSKRP